MPSSQSVPAIKAVSLKKSVVLPERELEILRGLDLAIKQGESCAIVGKSGSGKTTLLGILAGLDELSQGESWMLGSALHEMNEDQRAELRAQHVGFVFQSFHLLPTLSALQNVMLPLELAGAADAKEKAQAKLIELGLTDRLAHFPEQLSGGEQQRVALARAFVASPKILFADEPTGNLDSETGEAIIQSLFELNAQHGTTLVLVTHDSSLAERCDRRIHIADGMIAES
jgi:putative ABC transport system ATP-binding protein